VAVRVVRLGTRRSAGEGPRLGTVRRAPRGVPKARFARDDWYDLWLPDLAPSAPLVKQALRASSDRDWREFAKKYRKEMATPGKARLLELLATLSHTSSYSVGCYCEDEARCHRSVLRALLRERGAKLA